MLRRFRFSAFFALAAPFVPGCEQQRPPTAEGLRRIKARTATGTVNTKLEARVQPETPRAGEFSFWDLKVFDIRDKPDGTRKEWKFFNDLPQTSTDATISEVLMNAWVISRDGEVFLPSRPKYQAYGSSNTDWTIPRAGKYWLFIEYQPREKGKLYPVEIAKWGFTVAPGKSELKPVHDTPRWSPTRNPAAVTADGTPDGEPGGTLSLEELPQSAGQSANVVIKGAPNGAQGFRLAALTQDGTFFHFPRASDGTFPISFPKAGLVRFWCTFTLNGVPYGASLTQQIS